MDEKKFSDWRVFLLVALPLAAVFLATANWSVPYHLDAFTNVQTGYEIGRFGSPYVSEEASIGNQWSVKVGDRYASHYPPGAALHVAPLYAVWQSDAVVITRLVSGEYRLIHGPPIAPAAIVSALIAAIAMGLVAVASNRLVASRLAVAVGLAFGLGTGTWAVASFQLWQHGPAMMWIAAGTVMSINRPLGSGAAFAVSAIVRPHTAVIGFGIAAARWIHDRKIWPAALIAGGALGGLVALVMYNKAVYGGASINGGYGDVFLTRLLSVDNFGWYARNLIGALVDPVRGLFVYSPFLLLLIPGLRSAWRESPWWPKGAALGGVVYFLVQFKANRFSGGLGFFSYRYPLEFLAAAAPLLALSYATWLQHRGTVRRVFFILLGYSILMQGFGVVFRRF